jgi:hypothetical protein
MCYTLKLLGEPCHGSGGLVAGLSPQRLGFYPRPVHVGFVVDKMVLGQGFP